ncbi:hypothetical protein D3C76_434660 [compost metagenome]
MSVHVVGCKCGKAKEVYHKYYEDYGQTYVAYECEECNYYWEGYMPYFLSKSDKDKEE